MKTPVLRYVELFFLFLILPLVFLQRAVHIPKIPCLMLITAVCFLILFRDKTFDKGRLRTKTLPTAWLEHALYGDPVFTIGLGMYFYRGA